MGKPARNAEYTKEYNRKLFLRLLRAQPLSRSEIARRMGLTRAATSLMAEELLAEGYLLEPAEKPLGRNPVPLQLIPDAAFAVGICLNRDGCSVGIVNLCGQVVHQERMHGIGPDTLPELAQGVARMLQDAGIPRERVVGVGISAPGPLDGENGRILNPPDFGLWHHTEITAILREALGLPVYLENDAACMAQYNLGKPEAGGSENFLLLLVDRGIGSGVISRGKTLKGAGYFTGELGHTSIHFRGRRCACGSRGCLEAYASIPNLLRGSGFDTWQQVMDSRSGNPAAQELMLLELEYLTAGIVNMANLVSIDTVLLAGDIHYGTEVTAPLLEKLVNSRSLHCDILPIRVRPSCSGPDVPLQAAAEIAFGRFLRV